MELDILKGKKVAELREIANALKIEGAAKMKKAELLAVMTRMHEEAVAAQEAAKAAEAEAPAAEEAQQPEAAEAVSVEASAESPEQPSAEKPAEKQKNDGRYDVTGILDIAEGGFGFLRFDNFLTSNKDVYVSPTQIRRFNLKTGDEVFGTARLPNPDERFGAMLYVKTVNGDELSVARNRKDFSDLTPIYPNERICLEKGSSTLSMRLTDLVAPIGKGQRGIIVAPPKAGKTTLLKQIAKSIEAQDLGIKLIVLLIDERPEEVTDMKESI